MTITKKILKITEAKLLVQSWMGLRQQPRRLLPVLPDKKKQKTPLLCRLDTPVS